VSCLLVSDVQVTDGASLLFTASQSGHVEVVRSLLSAGVAVNQTRVRNAFRTGHCCWDGEGCRLVMGPIRGAS
jgi:ankyrin repeat protein